MAGETTQSTHATSTNVYTSHEAGSLCVVRESKELAVGELELNDVIEMVKLPAGARIIDGYLAVDDLDSNGTPLISLTVGITGDDPDGCLEASTIGRTGGKARFDGAYLVNDKTLTSEDTVDVKVTAAAATAQAGTVTLCVTYVTGE